MRIGIDIRKYYDFGIGTYAQNLVSEFQKTSDIEFVYFVHEEYRTALANSIKGKIISDNSPKYSIQELFSLSKKANMQSLDLFHTPHYTLPINLTMPSVVTIHDIIHLRIKKHYSVVKRSYAYFMIKHACNASSAIIVDSEFGKNELLDVFEVNPKKISVIPLGVDLSFYQRFSETELIAFRNKYFIKKPYLLYTGSMKPHKNIPILLKAFKKISKEHDVQLVFTGEKVNDVPQLNRYIKENIASDSVIDLGRINQEELKMAYQSASVVVLPSLYEGFGFSMVEAMASGVPAIGARSTSITEVVGDGGLLFDPMDENDLILKLNSILEDSHLRSVLIENGTKRAQQLSWKSCAEKTIALYRKVLS